MYEFNGLIELMFMNEQVKQQKKSSNKWNCVVCNQKQSVKVVYAQGYQAKDIRNFVQSFNMSRDDQFDQQQFQFVEDNNSTEENKSKRRTDWSEYIEDDSSSFEPAYLKVESNEKEMVAEQNIVTDFSEDLILKKRRILKRKFSSPADKEPNLSRRGTVMGKKCYDIVNDDNLMSEQSTRSGWKWNKYIEEEEEDDNGNSEEDLNIMLQFQGMDQPVEDDIHPDFI